MAWLIGDGFDFYNVIGDMTLPGTIWDNSFTAGGAVSTTTRFGSGVSVGVQSGTTYGSVLFANSQTIYVNFAMLPNTTLTPGSTTRAVGFFLTDGTPTGANVQTGVFVRLGGDIVVVSNSTGTVIATSPVQTLIQQGIWIHVQVKVVISNTVGSVEVRFNGNPSADWVVTGLNTRSATANNQCNHLYLAAAQSGFWQVDDFYAFNDAGASPNTWQGDVRAIQQMPASDSSVSWTPDSGVSRFARVNELRQNGDTSYVSTATIANVDQYSISALAITPLSIVAVQTKMFTRMDDAGPHQVKSRLTSGGSPYDSATITLSTSYQWLWTVYAQDPFTAANWSAANLNAALIGPVDVL